MTPTTAAKARMRSAKTAAERTGTEPSSIEETTAVRELSVILAEWRDAERKMALSGTDSAQRAVAQADIARLRDEYQRAYHATKGDATQEGT